MRSIEFRIPASRGVNKFFSLGGMSQSWIQDFEQLVRRAAPCLKRAPFRRGWEPLKVHLTLFFMRCFA